MQERASATDLEYRLCLLEQKRNRLAPTSAGHGDGIFEAVRLGGSDCAQSPNRLFSFRFPTQGCSGSRRDREVHYSGLYRLSGRRGQAQNPEAVSVSKISAYARTVSLQMGTAAGLSHGGSELCGQALCFGQKNGPGPKDEKTGASQVCSQGEIGSADRCV